MTTFKRDPATERLWFSVSMETHNDVGEPFIGHRRAAVRHHGRIVAFYGGWNGTERTARICAEESIPFRVNAICGAAT